MEIYVSPVLRLNPALWEPHLTTNSYDPTIFLAVLSSPPWELPDLFDLHLITNYYLPTTNTNLISHISQVGLGQHRVLS